MTAVRFAAALVFLLAALPAVGQLSPADPANGIVLVAKPMLADPNFREAVVLVTQAPDGSTVGVILNRPTQQRHERTREIIYSGGPVMREVIVALFRADRAPTASAFHVAQGIWLSMHPANLDELPSRPGQRFRLFAGFAGWAPGQLQRELDLDAWIVLPVTDDLLFRADTRGMWKELIEKSRGSRASAKIGDRLCS
jgi:putative transcriptional regulator